LFQNKTPIVFLKVNRWGRLPKSTGHGMLAVDFDTDANSISFLAVDIDAGATSISLFFMDFFSLISAHSPPIGCLNFHFGRK
jgi:hypothetical protein